MAYALSITIPFDADDTGIADLRAQFVDTGGVDVGGPITTGFSELGGGLYQWYYNAFANGFRGQVKFYPDSDPTKVRAAAINPQETETGTPIETWEVFMTRGAANLPDETLIEDFSIGEMVMMATNSEEGDGDITIKQSDGTELRTVQYNASPASSMITGIYR